LMIARHVVEKDKQIKKAMAFLQDCELLKIEDVLPFFPDFVLIDDFKEAIITALHEYNQHLDTLKNEMKETTKSAELIREDIKLLRNNYVFIEGNHKCELCKYPILTSTFYLFPCGHVFHCTCLQEEMKKYLSAENKSQLEQFISRLAYLEGGVHSEFGNRPRVIQQHNNSDSSDEETSFFGGAAGNIISNIAHMTDGDTTDSVTSEPVFEGHRSVQLDKQQLKDNIDNLVAYECFMCGKITVNSVDQPFGNEEKQEEANNSMWKKIL